MKTLKLQSEETGKIKYYHTQDGFPAKEGDIIAFKWNKRWEVIKIIKGKSPNMGSYIPDPEKFETFIDYCLAHPGEKITYDAYKAYKIRELLKKEEGGKKE